MPPCKKYKVVNRPWPLAKYYLPSCTVHDLKNVLHTISHIELCYPYTISEQFQAQHLTFFLEFFLIRILKLI